MFGWKRRGITERKRTGTVMVRNADSPLFSEVANSLERCTARARFRNSMGWKRSPAKPIHRLAPPALTPMPGIRVRTRRTREKNQIAPLDFFQKEKGDHVHDQHSRDSDQEPVDLFHPEGERGAVFFKGSMGRQGKNHEYAENSQQKRDDPEERIRLGPDGWSFSGKQGFISHEFSSRERTIFLKCSPLFL